MGRNARETRSRDRRGLSRIVRGGSIARRCARRLVALCLLFAVGACSTVGTLYGQLDTLAMWEARSWLDLDREQSQHFRRGLEERLERNRRHELPRYSALAAELAALAGTRPTAAEVHALIESSRELFRDTALATVPLLAATLQRLRPAQIDHLAAGFEESNAEYRAEFLDPDPATLREERLRAVRKGVERWSGRLDATQRARLARLVDEWPSGAARWYAHRLRWQQQLLAELRSGADVDAVAALLRDWWGDVAAYDADYAAELARGRWQIAEALAEVIGSLDARQRARAEARLQELAGDLEELHRVMQPS